MFGRLAAPRFRTAATALGITIGSAFLSQAARPDEKGLAFFETKVRPVLVEKCYGCHSSGLRAPMSGLTLDSKAGVLKGGVTGPVVVPGKPAESLLLKALSYTDPNLQMPPTGNIGRKLTKAAPVTPGRRRASPRTCV